MKYFDPFFFVCFHIEATSNNYSGSCSIKMHLHQLCLIKANSNPIWMNNVFMLTGQDTILFMEKFAWISKLIKSIRAFFHSA